MTAVYFVEGENCPIKKRDIVKVITYRDGKKIKIKNSLQHTNNNLKNYKKLNSEEYIFTPTGEILKYEKRKFKNTESIRKSMNKLNETVLNNFNGDKNELFITLTYAIPETDFDKAVYDLKIFEKKLKKEFQDIDYVAVIEEQQLRKSWHIHMLVKDFKHKTLIIPFEEVERIWNKGSVEVLRIIDKDLKQLSTKEDEEFEWHSPIARVAGYVSKTRSKENIPCNKKCYYKSRGIKLPAETKMNYEEAQIILNENEACLLSEHTLLIKSVITDKILNKVKEEIYLL